MACSQHALRRYVQALSCLFPAAHREESLSRSVFHPPEQTSRTLLNDSDNNRMIRKLCVFLQSHQHKHVHVFIYTFRVYRLGSSCFKHERIPFFDRFQHFSIRLFMAQQLSHIIHYPTNIHTQRENTGISPEKRSGARICPPKAVLRADCCFVGLHWAIQRSNLPLPCDEPALWWYYGDLNQTFVVSRKEIVPFCGMLEFCNRFA